MEKKTIKLAYTPGYNNAKEVVKEFSRDQAISILSLRNCAWELKEDKLEWNGEDIVVKKAK